MAWKYRVLPGAGAAGIPVTLAVQTFPVAALVRSAVIGKPGPDAAGGALSVMLSWMLWMSPCTAADDTAILAFAVWGVFSFLLLHPVPSTAAVMTTVASARLFFRENIFFSISSG